MKFIIEDRDRDLEDLPKEVEFSSLEQFVKWSIEVKLPRFSFISPNGRCGFKENNTANWMIYCQSDYD